MNFLPLSTEVNQAFVIPHLSPVSSPLLKAKQRRNSVPTMGTDHLTPLPMEEEDYMEEDTELVSAGSITEITLNE